jgi:hypothetical protein
MAKTRKSSKCYGVFGRVADLVGLPLRAGSRGVRGVARVANSGLTSTNSFIRGTAGNLNSTAGRLIGMSGRSGKTRRSKSRRGRGRK